VTFNKYELNYELTFTLHVGGVVAGSLCILGALGVHVWPLTEAVSYTVHHVTTGVVGTRLVSATRLVNVFNKSLKNNLTTGGDSSIYVYKELWLKGTYFHGPDEFLISGFYCTQRRRNRL